MTTKKRGREKLHFLNPVPIRLVHDRWVSKYAEPWAATLSGLKHRMEDRTMEKVFEIYIKTTPERLWEAITDSEMRAEVQLRRRRRVRLDARLPLRGRPPAGARRAQRGREPGGRSAAPARPELQGPVERRREERGDLAGHLGDRAGRRLLPADRHPRPAARGRQRRALRRLADDPLRPEDAAGDRRDAHDARLAALLASPATPFVPPARHLLRAKDLADARYFEPLGVDDLAARPASRAPTSAASSARVRRVAARLPADPRRLERAAALLRTTDRSVADICFAVGLQSVGSFTTSFTRTYGASPTVYRAGSRPPRTRR